jgi:hypothetical protein
VVDLESLCHLTTRHHTARVSFLKSTPYSARHCSAQVRHRDDVDTVLDDELQDRIAEHGPGHGDRYWPDTWYLTALTVSRLTTKEPLQVDDKAHHGTGRGACGPPGRRARTSRRERGHRLDEGIGEQCVTLLASPGPAGL